MALGTRPAPAENGAAPPAAGAAVALAERAAALCAVHQRAGHLQRASPALLGAIWGELRPCLAGAGAVRKLDPPARALCPGDGAAQMGRASVWERVGLYV